jgi:hypothetical protein
MTFSESPVSGGPKVWLRLEGLAALAMACLLYQRWHASWLLFAVLFLTPDLSMLAYTAGSRLGAAAYNAMHSDFPPLALAAAALLTDHLKIVPYALIWSAHIGFDRALGYGLKYDSAFGHTHLGWLGRQKAVERG